jgi:hypothetical protein
VQPADFPAYNDPAPLDFFARNLSQIVYLPAFIACFGSLISEFVDPFKLQAEAWENGQVYESL